jgi:ATP-binding cassette, subfamily B, bacterial
VPAAEETGRVVVMFGIDEPPEPAGLRHLPRLSREALRIAWAAGRYDVMVTVALQVVGGFGIAALLLLGQSALDALLRAVQEGASLASLLPWALAMAAVAGIQAFAGAVQRERQQILGELVGRYVQDRVLDVTTSVDLATFDDPDFHNRVQRMRMGGHQSLGMVFGLAGVLQAVIGVAAAMAALITIAPILVPLLLLVVLPAWLAASRRGESFYQLFWKMTPADRLRGYLGSLLADRNSAKEVRAFGLTGYLRRRHDTLYDDRIAQLRKVAHRQLTINFLSNLVIGAVLAVTLLVVAWLALRGTVPLSSAGVAVAGIAIVGQRLASAGWAVGTLGESGRYLEDYLAFTAMLPEIRDARPAGAAPAGFRRLSVESVTFSYPTGGEPALRGVSMEVIGGEVVALVGENGSGKTTLAKLLAGLYHPAEGTIRWDDTDLSTVDPDGMRERIAVIFQDFERFHLTAAENIGLGRIEAMDDRDAIEAAGRQAGADDFLKRLPDGYDTVLGPQFVGGTDLSVGQWQRMALARAFFREAPFIVLDEPTAALDPRAERELFERIRGLLAGRTVLLISHRFSSVRSADRIYVLDHGEIIESGDHAALMELGGTYAELFTLQAAAYVD